MEQNDTHNCLGFDERWAPELHTKGLVILALRGHYKEQERKEL